MTRADRKWGDRTSLPPGWRWDPEAVGYATEDRPHDNGVEAFSAAEEHGNPKVSQDAVHPNLRDHISTRVDWGLIEATGLEATFDKLRREAIADAWEKHDALTREAWDAGYEAGRQSVLGDECDHLWGQDGFSMDGDQGRGGRVKCTKCGNVEMMMSKGPNLGFLARRAYAAGGGILPWSDIPEGMRRSYIDMVRAVIETPHLIATLQKGDTVNAYPNGVINRKRNDNE